MGCPKLIACGHRCWLNCHPGVCGSQSDCTSTVKTSCPCKRIKKTVACNSSSSLKIECDETCRRKKEKEMEVLSEKERVRREEVEQFQRKFEKQRKHDKRRRYDQPAPRQQHPIYVKVLVALVPIVGLLSVFWWTNY